MDFFEQILLGLTPGRIAFILALFAALNLGLWFFLKSKLLDSPRFRSQSLRLNAVLLLFVFVLLVFLRQPLAQKIILFTPAFEKDESGRIEATRNWILADIFSRSGRTVLKSRYFAYRWQWLAEAVASRDKTDLESYLRFGRLIKAELIICPLKTISGDSILVYRGEDQTPLRITVANLSPSGEFWKQLDRHTGIFRSNNFPVDHNDPGLIEAELALICSGFESAGPISGLPASVHVDELQARIDLLEGIRTIRPGSSGAELQSNPYFKAVLNRLLPHVKERRETPGMAMILGKIAMYQDDFSQAEILVKRALAEDPENSRIYFELSSFLPERLDDLGFKTRREVLEKAIKLDPAYYAALLALSNDYYQQGSGTPGGFGTTKAFEILDKLNELYPSDSVIKSRLADILIKTSRFAEAHQIFKEILFQFPASADAHYNLGTTYFYQQKYDSAITEFSTAIRQEKHLDAYLFKGITFRQAGLRDSALFYFRERVRLKTGDDDRFAKEAMLGIRKILDEMAREEDRLKSQADSLKNAAKSGGNL